MFAQHGITKTQKNQRKRIQQGIVTGELTKKEAKSLIQGQKRINKMKKRAQSDGIITKRERKKIKQVQHLQSKRIFIQKHDRQKRS